MISRRLKHTFVGLIKDINLLICSNESLDIDIIEDKIYSENVVEYLLDKYLNTNIKWKFCVINEVTDYVKLDISTMNKLLNDEFSSYSASSKEPFTEGLALLVDVGLSVISDDFFNE